VNPYADAKYERSPMGRIVEAGGVGQGFQTGSTHTQRVVYSFNTGATGSNEEVRKHNSDGTSSSYFAANQLSRTETLDEDGNSTITLPSSGAVIAIKNQTTASNYKETYYIYDDLNKLKYILPPSPLLPEGNSYVTTQAVLNQYAYQFRYDNKGRVVQKKTPGQSWTWYAYDQLDRVCWCRMVTCRRLINGRLSNTMRKTAR